MGLPKNWQKIRLQHDSRRCWCTYVTRFFAHFLDETISAAAKLAKKGGYKDLNNWKKLGSGVIKMAPQTAGVAKAINMAQKANKVFKAVKASK